MAPLLSFLEVSKSYPDGGWQLHVLDRVSFAVEEGAAVGLYGQRRSGKSTLLRLAAAIEAPDAGSVFFDGQDVTACSQGERARLLRGPVALISTCDWLTSPRETVLDHVAMSLGSEGLNLREAKHRALVALDAVEVSAVGAAQSTASLSSGERARVMLARALVREPKLLMVDEPALMPSLTDRQTFCGLLRTVARQRAITLIMASEDMTVLQGLGTMMSISAGELCSTDELGTVVRLPRRRVAAAGRSGT
jgi:ABC-type methionine transport system ATPase subunit